MIASTSIEARALQTADDFVTQMMKVPACDMPTGEPVAACGRDMLVRVLACRLLSFHESKATP